MKPFMSKEISSFLSVFLMMTFTLFIACKKPGKELVDHTTTVAKPPLNFDESTLHPPTAQILNSLMQGQSSPGGITTHARTLAESAPAYYTYSNGNGIGNADFNLAYNPIWWGPEYNTQVNSFIEATYSSRLSSRPEDLWIPNGGWLQSGLLRDNEQAEQHFIWIRGACRIEVDYEVSSEENYDYLWICSTASDGSCNNPGVVRKKVSGQQSGRVTFTIDKSNCSFLWLGIYYIKDSSVSKYGDYARIKKVTVYLNIPA